MAGQVFATPGIASLEVGLQLLALRQHLLSNNIANANTPGYKRSDLPFRRVMQDILLERNSNLADRPQSLIVRDRTTSMKPDGNNVDVEMEMVRLTENNLTYQAAIRQLNFEFNYLRMAITEGRKG